jgi:hypothetical protein
LITIFHLPKSTLWENPFQKEKIEQRILNTCIWYHIFRTVLHNCEDDPYEYGKYRRGRENKTILRKSSEIEPMQSLHCGFFGVRINHTQTIMKDNERLPYH